MVSTTPITMWRFCALLLFLVNLPQATRSQQTFNTREKEKQVLDQLLHPSRYDARIRPAGLNGTDSPTIVRVNAFFRTITRISDHYMEYTVQLTFRQQWFDERLKYDDFGGKLKYLTLTDGWKLWMPDLFFSNEKEGHFHNIIMPNMYIRIFPYGSILYSVRISMDLSCPMNFKYYPHDRQMCSMRMASYGWTTDDLVFLWKDGDPVQVVRNLNIPLYTLESFMTDYCNSRTNTGEYSCLKVDLLFRREISYYLVHVFMPPVVLVIVSWISFWLDPRAVTARTCLLITTLLTITLHTSSVKSTLPVVNYIMAGEVWLGGCVSFVFGALLQLALVNYLGHRDGGHGTTKRQNRFVGPERSTHGEEISEALVEDGSAALAMTLLEGQSQYRAVDKEAAARHVGGSPLQRCRAWLAGFPNTIDVVSRVLFPLAFSLFCLVYCCTYVYGD